MLAIDFAGLLNTAIAVLVLGGMIVGAAWRLGIFIDHHQEAKMKQYVVPIATAVDDFVKTSDQRYEERVEVVDEAFQEINQRYNERAVVIDGVFQEIKDEVIAVGAKVEQINGNVAQQGIRIAITENVIEFLRGREEARAELGLAAQNAAALIKDAAATAAQLIENAKGGGSARPPEKKEEEKSP